MDALDERLAPLFDLLARAGDAGYIGESVSQLAHALQAGALARRAGAPPAEIAAALLHDVGHLCVPDDAPRMADLGVAGHEDAGADYLGGLGFGAEVTELVRAHVAAKRYLVATRPDYAARLSEASRGTLDHQGGPMDAAECAVFEADPLRSAKLRLRQWDETAKVAGLEVPALESYRPLLRSLLAERPTD